MFVRATPDPSIGAGLLVLVRILVDRATNIRTKTQHPDSALRRGSLSLVGTAVVAPSAPCPGPGKATTHPTRSPAEHGGPRQTRSPLRVRIAPGVCTIAVVSRDSTDTGQAAITAEPDGQGPRRSPQHGWAGARLAAGARAARRGLSAEAIAVDVTSEAVPVLIEAAIRKHAATRRHLTNGDIR
jgi:hypothetical protein